MDDRLQEVATAIGDRARQKQVIEYQKVGIDDRTKELLAYRRDRSHRVPGEELVGLDIVHPIPLKACVVGHRLGDVALARTRLAHKDGVGAICDELESVKLEACLLRDLRIEAPVKLLERWLFIKAGERKSSLDQPGSTAVEFVLQDQREGLQKCLIGNLGL